MAGRYECASTDTATGECASADATSYERLLVKTQPNPCPFAGTKCREFAVQTRTRTSVQWKRRCMECGREIIETEFFADSPLDLRRAEDRAVAREKHSIKKPPPLVLHPAGPAETVQRWVSTEKRTMTSRARARHLERMRNATPQ